MSSCQGLATKYTCLCTQNSSLMTSLCYPIPENIKKMDLSKVFTSPINVATYLSNADTLRLMAQLQSFDSLNFIIDTSTTETYFA